MLPIFISHVHHVRGDVLAKRQGWVHRVNVAVGAYEAIGGLVGISIMLWVWRSSPSSLPWGSITSAVGPFGLTAAAGITLLRRQQQGLALSLIVQASQVPFWSSSASVWKFSAGVVASVWAIRGDLRTLLGYDFSLVVGGNDPLQPHLVGVNLFALAIIILLVRVNWAGFRRRL
jgi:hypothetical protein